MCLKLNFSREWGETERGEKILLVIKGAKQEWGETERGEKILLETKGRNRKAAKREGAKRDGAKWNAAKWDVPASACLELCSEWRQTSSSL